MYFTAPLRESVTTIAFASPPPAISGIGFAGGFSAWIQDRSGNEVEFLAGVEHPPRRGHPIPIYRETRAERVTLAAGRALLVGDAAHLVDPLFGEGIYYAVLSGRLAAESITNHCRAQTPDLSSYADRVAQQIYPEFRIAARIAWMLYTFPRVFHRIVRRRPDIIQLFYGVLKGEETYQSFYQKAKGEAAGSLVGLLKAW